MVDISLVEFLMELLEGEAEAEGSVPVLGAGVRVQVPEQDGSMAQVNISEYI